MSTERNGKLWTHEETLAVFALYMLMENKDLSKEEDQDVIQFANAVKRTEGSVCIKLQNILAVDPNATRKGFANGADVLKRMWQDFETRGDDFVSETIEAYGLVVSGQLFGTESDMHKLTAEPRVGLDIRVMSTRRLNQRYFRKSLLDLYDYRCCASGLKVDSLLVASHIKPWCDSDPITERVNVENGLLLNSLHDRAFDKGLISVSDDYEILISRELKKKCLSDDSGVLKWLCDPIRSRIVPPKRHAPNPEFLAYHRDVIFKG